MNRQENLLKRLRQYRVEQQLTQVQLAKRLGVAFITLNRWLNGHAEPQELQRYRIERLLNRKR